MWQCDNNICDYLLVVCEDNEISTQNPLFDGNSFAILLAYLPDTFGNAVKHLKLVGTC